jgi:hypothetical protein
MDLKAFLATGMSPWDLPDLVRDLLGSGVPAIDIAEAVLALRDTIIGMTYMSGGREHRMSRIDAVRAVTCALIPIAVTRRHAPAARSVLEHAGINPWTLVMEADRTLKASVKAETMATAMGLEGGDSWRRFRPHRSDCLNIEGEGADEMARSVLGREGTLILRGNLLVTGCPGLTRLPDDFAAISLEVRDCPIAAIPAGIITRQLTVRDCDRLTELPDGLRSGSISAYGCASLERVGKVETGDIHDHRTDNGLFLHDLPRLTAIADLDAARLSITKCPVLETLPKLRLSGKLDVSECASLASLGDGLTVMSKDMTFNGMDSHTSGVTVSFCPSLREIGNGVRISSELRVTGCRSLVTLGRDIKVGALNLIGCDGFRSLGKGTEIVHHLYIQGHNPHVRRERVDGEWITISGPRVPGTWDGDLDGCDANYICHGPFHGCSSADWRARFDKGGVGLDGFTEADRETMARQERERIAEQEAKDAGKRRHRCGKGDR